MTDLMSLENSLLQKQVEVLSDELARRQADSRVKTLDDQLKVVRMLQSPHKRFY